MTLVFLLEERSTKVLLDILLPQIVPDDVDYYTIPHEGKSDLRKSIPRKIQNWGVPDTRFIIVQDQDSYDCMELKKELTGLCQNGRKPFLIRIACHEMEAWYFEDLRAVSKAYARDFTYLAAKSKYRIPDAIENPKLELKKLISEHEQLSGARRIGSHMNIQENTSRSFQVLIEGIKKMIQPEICGA